MNFQLQNPFTLILAGPSQSGKTTFCLQLIKYQNKIYSQKPGKIYYCYNMWQPKFDEMKEVEEFIEGIPSREKIKEISEESPNATLYLDDVAGQIDAGVQELFTVSCHHRHVNSIFLQHSVFNSNKYFREIRLNTSYFAIFKSPSDTNSIRVLARQIEPIHWRTLVKIYQEITSTPFSYLFLDFKQERDDSHRYRTNIFNEPENPLIIYKIDK